jgi:myo-inositol-1(or 4)-monophosphatase
LYQREVVAGSPKIYGQLVTLLAPYSQINTQPDAPSPAPSATLPSSNSSSF